MKTYELVINEGQPSCGGKSPFKAQILTVTTDDPVAYVQAREPEAPLEVETQPDGTVVVSTEHGGFPIRYEFTED